jgi:hypothetical protein
MVQFEVVCGVVLSPLSCPSVHLVAFDRLITLSLANCFVRVVTRPHCSYTMLSISCTVYYVTQYISFLNEIKQYMLQMSIRGLGCNMKCDTVGGLSENSRCQ